MKLRSLILGAAFACTSFAAVAQSGPYYLSSVGFCNVRKFYLASSGFVYGKEVGCTSTKNWTFIGYYTGGTTFTVTRMSSNNTTMDPTGEFSTNAYNLGNSLVDVYSSDGNSITGTNPGVSFTLSLTQPANSFSSTLPDMDEVVKK